MNLIGSFLRQIRSNLKAWQLRCSPLLAEPEARENFPDLVDISGLSLVQEAIDGYQTLLLESCRPVELALTVKACLNAFTRQDTKCSLLGGAAKGKSFLSHTSWINCLVDGTTVI